MTLFKQRFHEQRCYWWRNIVASCLGHAPVHTFFIENLSESSVRGPVTWENYLTKPHFLVSVAPVGFGFLLMFQVETEVEN